MTCDSCGSRVTVPDSKMKTLVPCPKCQDPLPTGFALPRVRATPVPAAPEPVPEPMPEIAPIAKEAVPGAKEYKVIEVHNTKLSGRFDCGAIERELNTLARDGWQVKAMAEFDPTALLEGSRAFMIVLERPLNPD